MTSIRRFSDEEFTSYLDGEASPELQQKIESVVATDPREAARLQSLAVETDVIKSAFDELLTTTPAPPTVLEQAAGEKSQTTSTFNYYYAAMAACALLLVGALFSRMIDNPQRLTWQDYAAKYHALYVKETLAIVSADDQRLSRSLARAEKALKLKLAKATLTSMPNLNLKRSQILGFEGRPLIQLAFLTTAGAPVALCITPAGQSATNAPKVSTMEGMAAASWSKAGFEFLLIGGKDEKLIRNAAETFHTRL